MNHLYTRNKSLVSKHAYSRRIAVDFDGTIAATTGDYNKIGDELLGAREFISKLREKGYTIVIYTCRTTSMNLNELSQAPSEYPRLMTDMLGWLEEKDFPYDEIWLGIHKPPCFCYIDDRAFSFLENSSFVCWESIYDAIVGDKWKK